MKTTLFIGIFVLLATLALAQPSNTMTTPSGTVVRVPLHATQVAPGVFSLGNAVFDGKVVQGFMIVDRKGDARSSAVGKPKGSNTCYAFLASGAKWKTNEPWVMNPTNSRGLDASTLLSIESAAIQKWESAAGVNIFGAGSLTNAPLVIDTSSPDGVNEVVFGDADGAIAVTTVWGVFNGPASRRQLVEWDQVFDDGAYDWSVDGSPTKMDFDDIATHEVGHALGMGHPSDSCTEETMYRFATEGETKKRSLEAPDVAGISALY